MKGRLKKKITKAKVENSRPQITIQEAWNIVADYLETSDVAYCCFINYSDDGEKIICRHVTQGVVLSSPRNRG